MRITPALLVLPLALAHSAPQRRHRVRTNLIRAGAPYSNQTIEEIDAASSSAAAYSASLAAFSASATPSSDSISSAAITDSFTSSIYSSSAVSSSAPSSVASQPSDTTTSVTPVSTVSSVSSDTPSSTEDYFTQSATDTSSTAPSVIASSSSVVDEAPTTISASSTVAQSTVIVAASSLRVTTIQTTASSTSSATAAAAKSSTSGLSKPTLIAIIVVACVVGLAAIGFTAFRKWKLRPSNRFDEKLKPIDFSPYNNGLNDDFLEKTLQRSTSNSSAQLQRQQFVSELDVPGVPAHDFTAGAVNAAGHGAYAQDTYHQDPFANAEQYDYDAAYYHQQEHAYPPAAHQGDYAAQEQSIVDGYADLQRGNSVGSGSGHGHPTMAYPSENAFPDPSNYLGRPTGGTDGPYAQAAQYRGY